MKIETPDVGEKKGPQIGRLAFRQEGGNWVAYYCLRTDSMEDAILLGSLSMVVLAQHPRRKKEFMMLMREVVGDLIEDIIGYRPVWGGAVKAPEHERSGNA